MQHRQFSPYRGPLTPVGRRPVAIARYALKRLFESRLFVAFFVACYIPSLALLAMVYGYYNAELVASFVTIPDELSTRVEDWLLARTLSVSIWITFLVVLVAGPALIAPDLANNAMPLYLCRGLRKREYVFGKLLALFGGAGAVTWVPGVLVVLLHGQYLPEQAFWIDIRLALALIATSLVWTGCLAMIAVAISAWVKNRPAATLGFLGLFVVAELTGDVLERIFGGWVGSAFDLTDAILVAGRTLYGLPVDSMMPAWVAWAVLLLSTVVAAAALAPRIRAGEVAA